MSSGWNVKVGDTAHAAKGADALVAEANTEREGRRADRLRIRAIVRIQSALRAHRERSNVMNKVRTTLVLQVPARALRSCICRRICRAEHLTGSSHPRGGPRAADEDTAPRPRCHALTRECMQISSKILDKYQSAVMDTDHLVEPSALLKEVIGPLTVRSVSVCPTAFITSS